MLGDKGKPLTAMEYARNIMAMTSRKPDMSVHARCSVAMIMLSLGLSLIRCHSFTVASNTRKAIKYPSTASAVAVSWKLAYLNTM